MSNIIISPISIDLGAKNTGVYFAHYEERSSIENIEKEGKVYQLEKDKYTLLMANRTAARHQRRGYDRRQMVKRLFKLIWEKHFKLQWDEDVQQIISFLLNRRGFTFLTEEYDEKILSQFPKEAFELLPEELKIDVNVNENGEYDFASALTEWANEGEGKVRKCFDEILLKAYYEKTRKNCQEKKTKDVTTEGNNSVKLVNTPKNIFEKLFCGLPNLKNRIETEAYTFTNGQGEEITARYNKGETFNILSFINNNPVKITDEIKELLPQEQKEWFFNPTGRFDLGKAESKSKFDNADDKQEWLKTYLHHLAYALHKTLDELESGGRHRSKYFNEVEKVLDNENHTYSYLKNFCRKLQSGGYQGLDKEKLARLIGHLSNLELKPLRKYFNDKEHQRTDYWDEARLSKIFDRWILREWRVGEKDKNKKTENHAENYKKLKVCWKKFVDDDKHHTLTENKKIPIAVIKFWLDKNPESTIPPYQDNNNRRPPKCQSLILNPKFLDKKYPEWQHWLGKLRKLETVEKYLIDFEDQLKSLESGKDNSYFSDKETNLEKKNGVPKSPQELKAGNQERRTLKALDARILQFILDRVKADDPLKLNEIYSHIKKWRQEQSTEQEMQTAESKLEVAIEESSLPNELKTDRDYNDNGLLKEGKFLHLVCKYYKQRQRAKDGRLFIHPEYRYFKNRGYENTGRFDDENCLLTYCNHKPRQKKYQSFHDIAGVLHVAPEKLKKEVCGTCIKKIVKWMEKETSNTSSLKANCERAAKEQKDRRGRLKDDISDIYKNDASSSLRRFCERAKRICCELTKKLYSAGKQESWRNDLERNPAAAVYLLAQLNNIAYKDRSGNSNICSVCSADNAYRMQSIEITKDNGSSEYSAKAQRLPAIPTRLIDGAVMRMARIVGDAITKDKWGKIKKELEADRKVRVPIIIESNRFEFEPSREELVKSQRTKPRKGKPLEHGGDQDLFQKNFQEKITRIKDAGHFICPYYEDTDIGNFGEMDHIIPRKSKWGTLNDEANLIWASHIGNHHKTNTHLSLGDLAKSYKKAQFPGMSDESIKNWIIEQIGNGEGESFIFGRYHSFINLTQDQRKAFRHALFLVGHDLRDKVIRAIDNRNRTLVNGTQRYFAEMLANKLYKKAKTIGEHRSLSFDYFEVTSDGSSSNISVPFVRKFFESKKDEDGNLVHPELQDHIKGNGQQSTYSHLIDAKTAFMIALSQHYKQGSLKINDQYISPLDYADEHGELKDLYNAIKVNHDPTDPKREKLERKKAEKGFFEHKTLFDSNSRAWHFLKLIEIDSDNGKRYLKGFLEVRTLKSCLKHDDWQETIDNKYGFTEEPGKENEKHHLYGKLLSPGEEQSLVNLYSPNKGKYQFGYQNERQQWPKVIIENQKLGNKHFTVRLYQIDKTKVAQFLLENFNTKSTPNNWKKKDMDVYDKLQKLWYFTKRKNLIKNGNPDFSYTKENLKTVFQNPSLSRTWKELNEEWTCKSSGGDSDCFQFLKEHFLTNKLNTTERVKHSPHQRVRKEFSLPISSKGQGFMLIARRTWNNKLIYQCQAEKSGEAGAGLYKKRINEQRKPYDSLTFYFRSRNIVLLKKLNEIKTCLLKQGNFIDVDKWFPLTVSRSKPEFKNIECIKNKYQSRGDSIWRITFKEPPSMEDLVALMYGGYPIDELKVGTGESEKDEVKKEAQAFFQTKGHSFIGLVEAKEKLEGCQNTINEKHKNNRREKTPEDKNRLKFIQCWLKCFDGLDGKTLTYKRGVGLQMEPAGNAEKPHRRTSS